MRKCGPSSAVTPTQLATLAAARARAGLREVLESVRSTKGGAVALIGGAVASPGPQGEAQCCVGGTRGATHPNGGGSVGGIAMGVGARWAVGLCGKGCTRLGGLMARGFVHAVLNTLAVVRWRTWQRA